MLKMNQPLQRHQIDLGHSSVPLQAVQLGLGRGVAAFEDQLLHMLQVNPWVIIAIVAFPRCAVVTRAVAIILWTGQRGCAHAEANGYHSD